MKRLLLFMLLLVTGLAPSWADKLKLHVTDMLEHNVANVKLRIGYDDAQYQTTDANGYVTFDMPNGFYESLDNNGAFLNLMYESDEYDVDNNEQPAYRFSTSTEFHVYAHDKGQTVNAIFESAQFFQFNFTQHLTQQQRNYLSGKALSFTVYYNDGQSSTRTILYKGESKKNLFLRTDKSCYKIICSVNSDYFGNVNNTIAELANGAIFLPASIGVDLTTGRIPVTLNSITGVDGKAVTEGQVGVYDLANGLPAVICYVGNNDYNTSVNCLLKKYQGFTYNYTLDSNNSFDIDLQNKGKEVTCTLKDHDGSPMANAEVLTLKRRNYASYDSLLVTTSNAQGEAHYYKVQSTNDITPWPIYINPNQKGYAGTEINPDGDDGDNPFIVIDYSKQKFVTLRIKNFNTDEWNKLYTQDIDFNVSYAIVQNQLRGAQTTSFNDGNDLVLRSFIDKSVAAKVCDFYVTAKLYANREAKVLGVLPYVVHLETLPSGDLNYTLAPLEWRKVKMEYALPKDLTLYCEHFSVDNVSFEYNNEVYDDGETNNSLLMPAGQHKLSMRFTSPSFLYNFGPEQTFNVTNDAQPQVATYTLLPQNYAGYTVTAIAPNGQPAANYKLAIGEELVSLNGEGKGGIYLSKLTGANDNQLKTLHYQVSSSSDYIMPYKWTGNVDNGIQQKTIHFDTEYYKYNVTVKTKEEARYQPQTVINWATTAQKLEAADQKDNTLSTDAATLNIYDWNHDEGSNLYSQIIYLPKGWVKGVTTLERNEYALNASQVTDNGALTFDFTAFSKVTFTYDGEDSAPGYGGELLLMRMADKKQISAYGNSLLLQPGEYRACYIGFEENGDMYYVQMPTKTFMVKGNGNDLNVNMVSAADEDYVNVRLNAIGLDDAAGKLTYASVYVVYDGLFVLTERNNDESYSFNSIRPWKMLKGHYDFKVKNVRFDYVNTAIVYNIDGQIDVKDNSSTFNIDFTGNHVFTSLAFVDAQGQAIDWKAMGLSVTSLKVIDNNGYAKSMDYIGSLGLIIANGDYKVEVYTYDKNYNLTVHEATLHVNDQMGQVGAISMNNLTGVASTVAANNKLQAKKEGNSLWVNGLDNEPIEVAVYNLSGVCVLHTTANNNERIDLDSLMRGTYIVRLRQGNHNTSIKVLK